MSYNVVTLVSAAVSMFWTFQLSFVIDIYCDQQGTSRLSLLFEYLYMVQSVDSSGSLSSCNMSLKLMNGATPKTNAEDFCSYYRSCMALSMSFYSSSLLTL